MALTILYEDNHLIVCLKPAGVLSQGGEMELENMLDLIKDYLKIKYQKPGNVYLGLVHRLDLNVGGVMVFAKTSKAAKRISEQVREHSLNKSYLAIAKGILQEKEAFLEDYLAKDEASRQAILANPENGKLAQLKYEILHQAEDDSAYSLVKIDLLTGRFHQIRFQLANIGHPLMGDSKYGDKQVTQDYFLGLYAYRLELLHPISKELMIFTYKPEDERFRQFKEIDEIEWRSK